MSESSSFLCNANWNEDWKELQKFRNKTDDAHYWDERAKSFTTKDAPSAYVSDFLKLAHIQPGESVFDMGCGTGALALPLAATGHSVIAGDFSRGMLNELEQSRIERGIPAIQTLHMSWEDNWEEHGLPKRSVDVAIASRSIAVADLEQALMKLTDVARKRVCITLSTGSSPRMNERILSQLGLQNEFGNDFLYAFNILASEGLMPELSYIHSKRVMSFDNRDDVRDYLEAMATSAVADKQSAQLRAALRRIDAWMDEHLLPNEHVGTLDAKGNTAKALRFDQDPTVTWAFISWNVP